VSPSLSHRVCRARRWPRGRCRHSSAAFTAHASSPHVRHIPLSRARQTVAANPAVLLHLCRAGPPHRVPLVGQSLRKVTTGALPVHYHERTPRIGRGRRRTA